MGYTEFVSQAVTVRINHKCIWCGETIKKGETAHRIKAIHDGEFEDDRYHPECIVACRDYMIEWPEDGFDPYTHDRGSMDEKY